jgi:hypothetical protein
MNFFMQYHRKDEFLAKRVRERHWEDANIKNWRDENEKEEMGFFQLK